MGSASCKNPKSSEKNDKTPDKKNITIGVFGLNNAGKTSAVKAIEGKPMKETVPTIGESTTMVLNPIIEKGDSKNQERVKIIDLSGSEGFREHSWANYYDQIHGLIFVIDASEKRQIMDNSELLETLLANEKLKDKPILILANKQDRKGAINDEDNLKHKLQIDRLKTKHKIELCTALPQKNNKPDESIRDGFSWLIETIDSNYAALNARVNNSRQQKPVDRRTPVTNKQKAGKSDRSDSDDSDNGVTYPKKRTGSPPLNKNKDYRSTNISSKLPSLDIHKNKSKPSDNGHATYSENDDDDDIVPPLRSNTHRPDPYNNDRNRPLNQQGSSAANNLNKKKKLIGAGNNDLSAKKLHDNEPKSFRVPYEPFPEEAPWSRSSNLTSKIDDKTPKPYAKPPMLSDSMKRNVSPLVRDAKPYIGGSLSKRDSDNDDDDDYDRRLKSKVTVPTITNRLKDNDIHKYTSPSATNKSLSPIKKTTSGIYGADDDKKNSTYRRSPLTTPVTSKKPYKRDDDDDDEDIGHFKKSTTKTTKSYNSDDDDNDNSKNHPRPSDRFKLDNDYRGLSSKPPASPSTRPKYNADSFPLSSSKPVVRPKYGDDDFYSASKPPAYSKFDDDDFPSSSSKIGTRPKYDDDDDSPLSSSKPAARSKFNNDSYSSALSKPPVHSRFDDDDRPSSPSKPAARSKFNNDSYSSALSKPLAHSRFDDDDRPSSASKPIIRSKRDDDDDDFPSTSRSINRSKFDDDDDLPSSSKPINRPLSSSKPTTRFNYDDDDDLPSSSRPVNRSKFGDNDRSSSSIKPTVRSKFDDDDDYSSPSSKRKTDADSYQSNVSTGLPKKNTYSSNYDDYNTSGSARPASGAAQRFRKTTYDDD